LKIKITKDLNFNGKNKIKRISRTKKYKCTPNWTKICTVLFFIFLFCIHEKIKSNIDQSKKENIIKTEEESEEKEINNDTAALYYKIQKRKRTKQLDYK
jgi:hypothetical protein